MIDTADILLKAAEDVQSGMWCKGAMFRHPDEDSGITVIPGSAVSFTPEQLSRMRRCATGSIALAVMQAGGGPADFLAACQRAANWIELTDEQKVTKALHFDGCNAEQQVIFYNDYILPDDPFDAGQQLGELFRKAAESL